MKILDLDEPFNPPLMLARIMSEMNREIREFGFLGSDEQPVELDRRPQSHIMHALNHVHINGECVKNRSLRFCP